MSEGWSVRQDNPWIGRRDLIPSNVPTKHPDARMRLTLRQAPDTRLIARDANGFDTGRRWLPPLRFS